MELYILFIGLSILAAMVVTGITLYLRFREPAKPVPSDPSTPSTLSVPSAPVKKDVGELCAVNEDCYNNACAYKSRGQPLNCCPSGKYIKIGRINFCTEAPKGSLCWKGAQCASGTCDTKHRCT